MIRIQRMIGPQSGLATSHTETKIVFGRDPRCHVPIDDPHVSRLHGELVYHEHRWLLVNRSANGATINGRPAAEGKPVPLQSGDVIGVGPLPLLSVQFTATAPQTEPPPADAKPAEPRLTRRSKLWIGIGIYLLVMAVVFVIVVSAVGSGSRTKPVDALPAALAEAEIAAEIRRPARVELPDAREAQRHLDEAQSWYPRVTGAVDGLYRAHRAYKLSLACSGARRFEGLDQLRFQDVEDKLVQKVIQEYERAYAMLANREYSTAETILRRLMLAYPDTESAIFQSVRRHLLYIDKHKPRR